MIIVVFNCANVRAKTSKRTRALVLLRRRRRRRLLPADRPRGRITARTRICLSFLRVVRRLNIFAIIFLFFSAHTTLNRNARL